MMPLSFSFILPFFIPLWLNFLTKAREVGISTKTILVFHEVSNRNELTSNQNAQRPDILANTLHSHNYDINRYIDEYRLDEHCCN